MTKRERDRFAYDLEQWIEQGTMISKASHRIDIIAYHLSASNHKERVGRLSAVRSRGDILLRLFRHKDRQVERIRDVMKAVIMECEVYEAIQRGEDHDEDAHEQGTAGAA